MNVRYLVLSLLLVLSVGFISYQVTHALFSDTAQSNSNTFAAAQVFPSATPTPTQIPESTPTPTPDLSGIATHVVISEVQIATPSATGSDFVELYNPATTSANLKKFSLVKRTKTGTVSASLKLFTTSDVIPAHGFFLWASSDGGYAAQIGADVNTGANITDDNSVALLDDSDVIVDAVAWGSGHTAPLVEGTPFTSNPPAGHSIERRALSTSDETSMSGADATKGNGFDSDSNSTDFVPRAVSQPQNSGSATEMP